MNKFAPPTGDDDVATGTVPVTQSGTAQPVPGRIPRGTKGHAHRLLRGTPALR